MQSGIYDINKQDGLLLVLKNKKEDNATVSQQHSRHASDQ